MGIIMRQDKHDGEFTASMDAIKDGMFGQTADAPVIFHRREMVRGEGIFAPLKEDPLFAMDFEQRWLAMVEATPFLALAGAIDKHEHMKKYVVWQYDPYHYCLEILLERFTRWCARHKFVGDVVVEARGKHADKRLKAAYRRFYDNGNQWITAERAQEVLISKELKFEHKEANVAAHQLADSLAHPVLRFLKTENLNEPPATGFGARLVDSLVKHRFARKPNTDLIRGWGTKWLPE